MQMQSINIQKLLTRNTFLIPLVLMAIALGINYSLQDNLFDLQVMNNSFRTWLPLIIVAVGQTIVILGGGIDLSVGTMVSMQVALLFTLLSETSTDFEVIAAFLVTCVAGMAAGALNGFAVAYLRLQPIVTTYATSFIFSGIALWLLPRPGGVMPQDIQRAYRRATPLDVPMAFYIIVLIIIFWMLIRSTRYAQYLYATGSNSDAAYTTGIPTQLVRFSTYVWSGLFVTFAAAALALTTPSGQANLGDDMTLPSIVAVVLGGTRLSGGQGGIVGSIIGVIILRVISSIISFGDVPTWSQKLVTALVIIAALAAPGLVGFLKRMVKQWL